MTCSNYIYDPQLLRVIAVFVETYDVVGPNDAQKLLKILAVWDPLLDLKNASFRQA